MVDKVLGVMGVEITSAKIDCCYHCGVKLTKDNNSEWEVFTEVPGVTAPVCQECYGKLEKTKEKP